MVHHDDRRDAACCHTCLKALQSGILTLSNADPPFTRNRFSNWKSEIEKKNGFQKHESSDSHMEAVARYVTCNSKGDISDLLSERHALEKSKKDFALNPVRHPILNVTGLAIKRRLEH